MIVRIFLFLVFSCVSALAQTFTIGETLSVGNTIDSGNANAVLAQPVTLTQTATLQSLSFYVVNPAGNLVLGLYGASASRAPGQLLAYTQPFVPVAGWNTHPVINQPILVPGTYFLAYFASDNNLSFPIFFSSNWCGDYPVIYSGVFPQSFAFVHGDAGHWAFYATLNVTASPGSNPLSGKHGLKLFGGVQGWHDSSYTPPDPLWKPISQGPATGNQFPSNWWRDDWTFNASQPWGDGTSAQPLLQTASNYCKANGLNGPTIQLWYPGHSPGSWTTGNAVSNMIAYLQFINKYIAPGTFEIVTNETLSGNGQVQNSDPLLIALGGTGKTGWDAIINLVKLMRQYCPNALLGMNDTNMMAQDGSGSMYNQQAAINCYKACHDSGAPMDWLGEEGYWMNSKVATIAGWQDAINYMGSSILPYLSGACGTAFIGFTEFTPACDLNDGGIYNTQHEIWQSLLPMFAANQYVFGVTGPWEGFRRSNGFHFQNWLYDDTTQGGTDPECLGTSDGNITATLAWLQGWVATNVHQ